MDAEINDILHVIEHGYSLYEKVEVGAFSSVLLNMATQDRLQKWCDNVCKGDWGQFESRLRFDDLMIDDAKGILNWRPELDSENLPDWAEMLRDILLADEITIGHPNFDIAELENEEQWLEIALTPIVAFARQRLKLAITSLGPD